MNKSSIERARAAFRGNEFGKYELAHSPWVGILWLWAFLVALGALVWLYGCTPAVADNVPAEAQAMNKAFNSPACRLHKSTEARMQCAIDKSQGV